MLNNPFFVLHKLQYFGYQVRTFFMELVAAAVNDNGIVLYFYYRVDMVFFTGSIFQCYFQGIK